MKYLIVGDLHGNVPKVHYKKFDAIIAPGDFCSDSARKYMFQAVKERLRDKDSKINWYDIAGKRESRKIIKNSLKDGRKSLEYLNSLNVPVYIVPGNWDWTKDKKSKWKYLKEDHYSNLISGLSNIIDTNYSLVDSREYQFIGYGESTGPEYPQHKEDLERLTKKQLSKRKKQSEKTFNKISKKFEKANKPIIFLTHNVPFNTSLDEITDKSSPRVGYHFGSTITRDLIEKYQPLVNIGGHMHEHHDKDKIKNTTCINAGFGSKVNTLLELTKGKIDKIKFYPNNN